MENGDRVSTTGKEGRDVGQQCTASAVHTYHHLSVLLLLTPYLSIVTMTYNHLQVMGP
jgi:hypothetical protein